jgi:preprotein translocase subunit SecD
MGYVLPGSILPAMLSAALLSCPPVAAQERGTLLVYEIPGNPTHEGLEDIRSMLEARLSALGIEGGEVASADPARQIIVRLPVLRAEEVRLAKRVLANQGKLEIRPVAGPEDWKPVGITQEEAAKQVWASPGEDRKVHFFPPTGTPRVAWMPPYRTGKIPAGERSWKGGQFVRMSGDDVVAGCDLEKVYRSTDAMGLPLVAFDVRAQAQDKVARLTGMCKDRQLAILFDDRVVSAPVIRGEIRNSGVIEGISEPGEIRELVITLQSGCLPVRPVLIREEALSQDQLPQKTARRDGDGGTRAQQ